MKSSEEINKKSSRKLPQKVDDLLKYTKPANLSDLYKELFEFCPVGLFKINFSGDVIEMNEFGASLLGEMQLKRNLNFHTFLTEESNIHFENILVQVRYERVKSSITVELIPKNNNSICTLLSVLFSENENLYLLSLIDISEQTKLEIRLNKKSEKLEWINQMLISREIRMIELKKEVNNLLEQLGEHAKYDLK